MVATALPVPSNEALGGFVGGRFVCSLVGGSDFVSGIVADISPEATSIRTKYRGSLMWYSMQKAGWSSNYPQWIIDFLDIKEDNRFHFPYLPVSNSSCNKLVLLYFNTKLVIVRKGAILDKREFGWRIDPP